MSVRSPAPTYACEEAVRYANVLLESLGALQCAVGAAELQSPALAWRRSGLWALTGLPGEVSGWMCPVALASAADGVLLALQALAPGHALGAIPGSLLLAERARLLGLARHGRVSANGTCRLMQTGDGRVALNLARPSDWDLVPLLIDGPCATGDWAGVERGLASGRTVELAALATELGLPLGVDQRLAVTPVLPRLSWSTGVLNARRPPRVIELASLWAGPLAGALLAELGADVLKIESATRLDGARGGHPGFFDLLNERKRMLTFEWQDAREVALLDALLQTADIVIEGSRPRALEQTGIDRHRHVSRGAIWVSITAHADPERVGFGDDAGVEAGLAARMDEAWGEPVFVGDAIADPLTGLHSALAAWATWQARECRWIPMSLSGTTAFAMSRVTHAAGVELESWQRIAESDRGPLSPLRRPRRHASAAGAHNGDLQKLLRFSH